MSELFAREKQHDPRAMLKDLVVLYCLHYDINVEQATKALRADALDMRKWWAEEFRTKYGDTATMVESDLSTLTP